jgi:hypothetical protein
MTIIELTATAMFSQDMMGGKVEARRKNFRATDLKPKAVAIQIK